MNPEEGTNYQLRKVTARPVIRRGASSGPNMITLHPRPDVQEAVVNGEKQPVVSPRSVILMAWAGWKADRLEQSKDAMRRCCEYISAHGYRGGASRAMAGLETMSFNHGAKWIKRTFAKHVRDGMALIRYVLPQA